MTDNPVTTDVEGDEPSPTYTHASVAVQHTKRHEIRATDEMLTLSDGKLIPCLGKGIPSSARTSRDFNLRWALLLRSFAMHDIAAPYTNTYMCWILRPNLPASDFWLHPTSSYPSIVEHWQTHRSSLERRASPIYVERSKATPFGYHAAKYSGAPRSAEGLYVQTYGVRNQVPCERCERMWLNHSNPGNLSGREVEGGRTHVMTPFFECISIPGYSNGACGGCVFEVQSTRCTYSDIRVAEAPSFVSSLRATDVNDDGPLPRILSLTATPPIEPDFSSTALLTALDVHPQLLDSASPALDLPDGWSDGPLTHAHGRL